MHLTNGELLKKFPIEFIVTTCHPDSHWKTFSCKRRLNELFQEDTESKWRMLEDGIKEANQLYQDCIRNYTLVISIERWLRLQFLIPWTANAIYYGVLGNK